MLSRSEPHLQVPGGAGEERQRLQTRERREHAAEEGEGAKEEQLRTTNVREPSTAQRVSVFALRHEGENGIDFCVIFLFAGERRRLDFLMKWPT